MWKYSCNYSISLVNKERSVFLFIFRGHLKTFIHAVHLLLTLKDIGALPVSDILCKLIETEGGQGHVPAILGSKHILCWGFEDLLNGTEKESGEKDKCMNFWYYLKLC